MALNLTLTAEQETPVRVNGSEFFVTLRPIAYGKWLEIRGRMQDSFVQYARKRREALKKACAENGVDFEAKLGQMLEKFGDIENAALRSERAIEQLAAEIGVSGQWEREKITLNAFRELARFGVCGHRGLKVNGEELEFKEPPAKSEGGPLVDDETLDVYGEALINGAPLLAFIGQAVWDFNQPTEEQKKS